MRDFIRETWGWAIVVLLVLSGLITATLFLVGYYFSPH